MAEHDPLATNTAIATGEVDPLAGLNDGFLGTGYTSAVEISLIVGALMVIGVAVSLWRAYGPETRIFASIADAIGLRD